MFKYIVVIAVFTALVVYIHHVEAKAFNKCLKNHSNDTCITTMSGG